MSISNSDIQCHGCSFRVSIQHRPITLRYVFADGSSVDHHRRSGWCPQCATIREIEAKLDLTTVNRDLAHLELKSRRIGRVISHRLDRAFGGTKAMEEAEELSTLRSLRRLAENRQSPPRCLSCGTIAEEISFTEEGTSENFIHSCGGRLYQVPMDPDAPLFRFIRETIYLDTEGRRLQIVDSDDE